ncbi:DUF1996 domain-containing protein [Qipengyuania atrilutea]|uniref:DUF1996 domain-containing protein n=1 Tax=Qipengyuania atrilutea TaxID=2744473 RepID=A0A850GYD0_9SPHN|nr:DUF1996 domain-containing protein [Actirhodobacter atriluteus]NVD43496.1 DUF1996 domain-containing protein [Actirhodobacter atriluteus]
MRLLMTIAALFAAAPSLAQDSPLERAEQGRIDLNESQNELAQARYDFGQVEPENLPLEVFDDWAKMEAEARTGELALRRALYAVDKLIEALRAGGVNVPTPEPEPLPDPMPDPEPIPNPQPPTDSTVPTKGLAAVQDGLDYTALTYSHGRIAGSSAPDVVGAFRFICAPGQLRYDDPVVFPGKPGASHLHQFFGNLEADGNSTYESLRKSGESTCTSDLNRSAYWMPALLTGDGHVVRPEYFSIYYKRRPLGDAAFENNGTKPARFPRGLRYIFGWDAYRASEYQKPKANFKCNPGEGGSFSGTMTEVLARCPVGGAFYASLSSPKCWNGTDLDSPDHQAHMTGSYRNRDSGYIEACPSTHPYMLPTFTITAKYVVQEGEDTSKWYFASDPMAPEEFREPGYTLHADWFGAWNDLALNTWQEHCIEKMLNCSDFNFGNGSGGQRNEYYHNKTWNNTQPDRPAVPTRPEGTTHAH